jgi:hypothetical protein
MIRTKVSVSLWLNSTILLGNEYTFKLLTSRYTSVFMEINYHFCTYSQILCKKCIKRDNGGIGGMLSISECYEIPNHTLTKCGTEEKLCTKFSFLFCTQHQSNINPTFIVSSNQISCIFSKSSLYETCTCTYRKTQPLLMGPHTFHIITQFYMFIAINWHFHLLSESPVFLIFL